MHPQEREGGEGAHRTEGEELGVGGGCGVGGADVGGRGAPVG
jgi:hypothetical protein